MGAVNHYIAALILALSPLVGYLISMFAKEELKPGKKWFLLVKQLLFASIAVIFLFAHKWQIMHATLALLALFAYFAFPWARAWWAVWAVFGIGYALTAQTAFSFLMGATILLYGLLSGAVLAGIKKPRGALAAGAIFLAVAGILLYFL